MDDDDSYDEAQLREAPAEELLREYQDTVHHLGVCDAEGQIDMRERRWEERLFEEILLRMEATPGE